MRKEFSEQIVKISKNKKNIFLSGDLGFMALEGVRESYGKRFINCGVSEQNMIGVAAGMSKSGFKVFAYSIAPFIYARPFEQIRNDIVFHNLPVCLVGNGGGYAYGYMGPTHHALEDCAVMNALGINVVAPAFDKDIGSIIKSFDSPTYLRLGYEIVPEDKIVPKYNSWRMLEQGNGSIVIGFGPMAGLIWDVILTIPKKKRPTLWAVTEFDMQKIPKMFLEQIKNNDLYVFEEHVRNGGLGMNISLMLSGRKISTKSFRHFYARGYPKKTFGSQNYHRKKSNLDKDSILSILTKNQ